MSTDKERLAVIERNYKDALENEPHDLAQAQTAVDVTAIRANVATARETYFKALASELTNTGDAVEQTFQAAKAAQAAVKTARDEAAAIPTLIGKLKAATEAAQGLVDAAGKEKKVARVMRRSSKPRGRRQLSRAPAIKPRAYRP